MLQEVADAYEVIITQPRRDMIARTVDVASAFATSTLNDDELTELLGDWEDYLDHPGLEDGPSGWWKLMNGCYVVCAEMAAAKGGREALDLIFDAASGLPTDLQAVNVPRLVRIPLDEEIDEAAPAGRLVVRLLEIAQQG